MRKYIQSWLLLGCSCVAHPMGRTMIGIKACIWESGDQSWVAQQMLFNDSIGKELILRFTARYFLSPSTLLLDVLSSSEPC